MSEYWKSTPKYWCKHCKTYVRDTKLEKTSHEATPKHQGNLKRFLRDLHRGHEREEREKQRAKDEVQRLNGVVSGSPLTASGESEAPWKRKRAVPPAALESRQASLAERKQQLAQLAEMGVAIPDEYRREMAMAGDWQTLSERPIYQDGIKKEEALDVKPDMISTGIRKRRYEGQEEEEAAREAERAAVRMNWGSTTRTYPEGDGFGDDDLDKLLERSKTIGKGKGRMANPTEAPENTRAGSPSRTGPEGTQACATHDEAVIKREDSGESSTSALHTSELKITGLSEDDDAGSAVVFRKRKAKSMRQK